MRMPPMIALEMRNNIIYNDVNESIYHLVCRNSGGGTIRAHKRKFCMYYVYNNKHNESVGRIWRHDQLEKKIISLRK